MSWLQTLYRQRLERAMAGRSLTDLSKSAIVFAPHPDDETLGCGGTIIQKKASGAVIKLVFMTDGSRSHASWIAPDRLSKIRQQEALAAAHTLGIQASEVTFFNFNDGQLDQHRKAATHQVRQFLQTNPVDEVFVPYHQEPPADHAATYLAVKNAIAHLPSPPKIYAYPIWYWEHWPWMAPAGRGKKDQLRQLWATITSGLGTQIFKDFQHSVCIESVIVQKKAALSQHASQMKKPAGHPEWPTLGEVSQGDFLACFFQNYEIFHSPSR